MGVGLGLRRVVARVVIAVAASACLVMALGAPALAHAQLLRSDPAADSVLETAPAEVALTFGEQVLAADATVDVYDDKLGKVTIGPPVQAGTDGLTVAVRLSPGLGRGTYTVAWRVSSADTHPVVGSFRFSVGTPSAVQGHLPNVGRNDLAGGLLGVLRWVGFAGLALGPGALLGALLVWPAGLVGKPLRRVVATGYGLLALSVPGGMLLQGVYASGLPLSALWQAPEALNTQSRRFDQVYAVRAYLVVALALGGAGLLGLTPAVRSRWRSPLAAGTGLLTAGLLVTWPLVGHSASAPGATLAVLVNVVHVGSMTVWLGGLVVVVTSLWVGARSESAAALARFSPLAFTAMTALVGSGLFLAWRELGGVGALFASEFGRVLLVKSAAVAVLLVLADRARRWVHRHDTMALRSPDTSSLPERRSLAIGLAGELALAAIILVITAALVVIVPGRQAVGADRGAGTTTVVQATPRT